MEKTKKTTKNIFIIILLVIAMFAAIFINHKIQLNKESKLLTPIGELVEVDGHNMSIYTEGSGDKTLVFLSGGGTCSPILDFKSLYSLLSDEYKIVVVEKFGYGFSDIVDKERDIESILNDTRAALSASDIEGPFVLCPHSMSGLEALYWAQQYPEEVSAIIGLDMFVPKSYENFSINIPMMKLSQFAARTGIIRFLPNVAESDAIKYGTLTEEEKAIYRAVFYSRTATTTMLNEMDYVEENAEIVDSGDVPQVPMLLFVSNGEGTGRDGEDWLNDQKSFIKEVEHGEIVELDCPHYVHDYEYQAISEHIADFLSRNDVLSRTKSIRGN